MEKHVKEFHEKQLNNQYVVVYMDATMLNVRHDCVCKEAIHTLLGISKEGYKEFIDFGIYPSESYENYKEKVLNVQNVVVQKFFFLLAMAYKVLKMYVYVFILKQCINLVRNISVEIFLGL